MIYLVKQDIQLHCQLKFQVSTPFPLSAQIPSFQIYEQKYFSILAFRFRKLAIIVSVLVNKPNAVSSQTPSYLQWTLSSTLPPSTTVQCECLEKPWILFISIIIILIFLILHSCQFLQTLRNRNNQQAGFSLAFRNTKTNFLMNIISLPNSISPWK